MPRTPKATRPKPRPDPVRRDAVGAAAPQEAGLCARCGPPPLLRCLLSLEWALPEAAAWPTSRTRLGASLVVCDKCAFTLLACLERGTGQTPIVAPARCTAHLHDREGNVEVCELGCDHEGSHRCGGTTWKPIAHWVAAPREEP